jgi:hypothetical protein
MPRKMMRLAWRCDPIAEDLEAVAQLKPCDLVFDQPLRRMRQRSLRLADADSQRTLISLAGLDQQFAEEV